VKLLKPVPIWYVKFLLPTLPALCSQLTLLLKEWPPGSQAMLVLVLPKPRVACRKRTSTVAAAVAAGAVAIFAYRGDFSPVVESIVTWVERVVAVSDAAAGAVGTEVIIKRAVFGGIVIAAYGIITDVIITAELVAVVNLCLLKLRCRGSVGLIYLRGSVAIRLGFSRLLI
jgi:hypothetical protein